MGFAGIDVARNVGHSATGVGVDAFTQELGGVNREAYLLSGLADCSLLGGLADCSLLDGFAGFDLSGRELPRETAFSDLASPEEEFAVLQMIAAEMAWRSSGAVVTRPP